MNRHLIRLDGLCLEIFRDDLLEGIHGYGHFFRQRYAGTYYHYINIRTLAMQEQIPHPTADYVALQVHPISRLTDQMQHLILNFRVLNTHHSTFATAKVLLFFELRK